MCDKASDQRQVSREEAEHFRKQNQIDFFAETSAKTGENVLLTFITAAKMLFSKNRDKLSTMASLINRDNESVYSKESKALQNEYVPNNVNKSNRLNNANVE